MIKIIKLLFCVILCFIALFIAGITWLLTFDNEKASDLIEGIDDVCNKFMNWPKGS